MAIPKAHLQAYSWSSDQSSITYLFLSWYKQAYGCLPSVIIHEWLSRDSKIDLTKAQIPMVL